MRPIEDIQKDILEAKRHKKVIKKEFGKFSPEYFSCKEEIADLEEELEFSRLHL